MKHRLESRLPGEISVTTDTQMTPPLWQKVKNWRASWWQWRRRVKKLAWRSTFRKLRSWHPVLSLHADRWGSSGNSDRLYFGGSKITADGDCSHEVKRCLLLGRKIFKYTCFQAIWSWAFPSSDVLVTNSVSLLWCSLVWFVPLFICLLVLVSCVFLKVY